MRRSRYSTLDTFRNDLKKMVEYDGSTITFEYMDSVCKVYNEIYEVCEEYEDAPVIVEVRGIGKVIKSSEDEVEMEWGRLSVGTCLITFPYDADLSKFEGKTNLRFYFLGRKWALDSPLNAASYHNDEIYSRYIKGIKALN
ncbi:hypothetical protein [Bacillus sp. UMB0893]|uniref:hypothetical protein n=1 Tax=Bacillus sp. UMB0893 TaxID=2066053 RepID=UPI000C7833B5|nr:hypothetical protein [Bacillus sp. UMB0893]PLR69103.1 hypothetical protein CYJ36_01185 [Bacillus sp. UMB0893]